jgi:exopolyphosphatase/guanosine-5'-triphosphate,3'-diphosphate pyrophosphatase
VKVAAIDIGSNSVRLLITASAQEPIVHRVVVTGLGRGVDASGMMREDAIEATLDSIDAFVDEIRLHRVDRFAAVATSASRDAANGPDLMDRVAARLGTRPEVISGDREASLSFSGATSGLPDTGTLVVVDIGGGSTEIIEGSAGVISWTYSFDIGSVRLTDRTLPDRPASPHQIASASAEVDRIFSHLDGLPRATEFIGVAGTFTSLSAMQLGLSSYDSAAVHLSTLNRGDLIEMRDWLATLTLEETRAVPSLDPKRAPVILAGAVIAERVMAAIGADRVVVSERDLLSGLAAELLDD